MLDLQFEGGSRYSDGGIVTVSLYGGWYQMGRQYGFLLKKELKSVVHGFIASKIDGREERMQAVVNVSEALYKNYPERFKEFFRGAEETSDLSLKELKMANAVEYIANEQGCSGIAFWGEHSSEGLVYGRNYDYPGYHSLCGELIVTVYHPDDSPNSVATVGYAGEIYTVNAINDKGLFLELNNGMPSAGSEIDFQMRPSTTRLLEAMLVGSTLDDLDNFFRGENSFASFIIGVADKSSARSYEWCRAGVKIGNADGSSTMVMTNHYVNPEWSYDIPKDKNSWNSITRRCNLESLIRSRKGKVTIEDMKEIISIEIENGGAKWDGTVYQMVVSPGSLTLWLKVIGRTEWVEIPLKNYLF